MKIVTLILLLFASNATAQEMRTFLSPGVKFGYQWDVGMFAGLEISYTIMPATYSYGATYGATFNLDLLRSGGYKLHFGLQGGHILGSEIGPTFAKERGKPGEWGYSWSVFGLVAVMPYYTYTDLFGRKINESGVLIKLPARVTGPELGSLFKT